jgi:hypothetical protein
MAEHDVLDCTQVETIQGMRDLLMQMSELQLEERQERRAYEKRLMDILEKLADQGARLSNTEGRAKENHEDLNHVADKVRALELAEREDDPRIQEMHTFYRITTNKYALYCYGTIFGISLLDFITNMIYHREGIIKGITWTMKIFNGG